MKNCQRCKEDKAEGEFYANPIAKDGLRHICKPCDKALAKENKAKRDAKRDEGSGVDVDALLHQIDDGSFVVDQKWLLKELVKQYSGDKVRDKLKALQLIAQISGYKEDDADERSIVASLRDSLKQEQSGNEE